MSHIDTLMEKIAAHGSRGAIYWSGREYGFDALLEETARWTTRLDELEVTPGTVCGVADDYSPSVCALFLALMKRGAIIAPFTRPAAPRVPEFIEIAGVERFFRFDRADGWTHERRTPVPPNALIEQFRGRGHAGLVFFTSGSTGKPKGILHDCETVLDKFTLERKGYRTLLFLLMDHFGGFNTLMTIVSYGGLAAIVETRTPEEVCRTIQDARIELLPTTPTFLNFLLSSRCHADFDLSSLKLVTYGTESMPETTLTRMAQAFPSVRLQQTYGSSELGVLHSKSKGDGSLWVQVGGKGFETKVVAGVLYVRSQYRMVGYLNAPDPLEEDGWISTGDLVESDGEYIRILGRTSDIINVGGAKVFPIEVEKVLLEADNIIEAAVYGVPNPLMGQVVAASVSLATNEDPLALKIRLRKFCQTRLASHEVPVKLTIVPRAEQASDRGKKIRQESGPAR